VGALFVVERELTSARGQAVGAPTVVTGPADRVHVHSARLMGSVNPEGVETRYRFEYGRTTAYGASTPAVAAGAGVTPVSARADLDGLRRGTSYHYRLVASNALGTAVGADATVTTRDPRLRGAYRVRLRVVAGGRVFGQRRGDVVHRTYRFAPRCGGVLCRGARLVRTGQRGRFRSTLGRVRSGVYSGTERVHGGRCDDGLRFHTAAPIKVSVERTAGDRASRIRGRLRLRAGGCAMGSERARLRGRAIG
jgi:hypothetical protein